MNKPHCDLCDKMLTDEERKLVEQLTRSDEDGIAILKYPTPAPKKKGDEWNNYEEQNGYGSGSPLSAILFGSDYSSEQQPRKAELCLRCTLKIVSKFMDRLFKSMMKIEEVRGEVV